MSLYVPAIHREDGSLGWLDSEAHLDRDKALALAELTFDETSWTKLSYPTVEEVEVAAEVEWGVRHSTGYISPCADEAEARQRVHILGTVVCRAVLRTPWQAVSSNPNEGVSTIPTITITADQAEALARGENITIGPPTPPKPTYQIAVNTAWGGVFLVRRTGKKIERRLIVYSDVDSPVTALATQWSDAPLSDDVKFIDIPDLRKGDA